MDHIQRILARALPGHAVASCEPVTGGVLNSVYRITVEGMSTEFALRIYLHDPAACRKEVDLHRLVAEHVPVPEIVFADPEGDPPCALMHWIPGETWRQIKSRRDARELAECGRALGEVLARIGAISLARQIGSLPIEGPDPVPRMIEMFLASPHAAARVPSDTIARVCDFAWSRAPRLATLDAASFLVHSDFGGPNVILHKPSGEWQVAAVLDWEFAFSGSPLYDVGHALRYERADRPTLEPHFSTAYGAAGGRLPEDWRDLARTLDLTALTEILSRPALPETVVAEILDLIRHSIE